MRRDEYQNGEPATPEACRRFDAELSAYLEGEGSPEVTAHASECLACSAVLDDLQQVISASARLGYEDPPPQLWANIRASLAAEGLLHREAPFWMRWLPAVDFLRPAPVAALACLLVVSVLLVRPPHALNSASDFLPQPSGIAQVSAPEPELAAKGLEDTVQQLQSIYQGRAVALHPVIQATYQRSLRSLDSSIEECRNSIRREPANNLAREYLLAAYEEKAQVLESALEYDGR